MREPGAIFVSLALVLLMGCPATLSLQPYPIADAGADRIARVAEVVSVGTPLRGGLRAEWRMVSATGGYVFLGPTGVAQPRIVFHDPGTYVLSVVVSDGTLRSDPDYVSVRVEGCEAGDVLSCYPGPAETEGVGACRAGERTCFDDGRYGPCIGAVLPEQEVCGDGEDGDCDGWSDEADPDCAGTCPQPPRKQATCGEGACEQTMELVCQDGMWTSCIPGSPTEAQGSDLCDGVDGDCDGETDEDAPVVTWYPDLDEDGAGNRTGGEVEACAAPPGSWSRRSNDCDDGDANVHPGTACDDGADCTVADICGPGGLCAGIPTGCTGCAESCESCTPGGCCEATCTGAGCGSCPTGCACRFDCSTGCNVVCQSRSRCGAKVTETSGNSTLVCNSGAVCDLSCERTNGDCRLDCKSGADCSLQCKSIDDCILTCGDGSRCSLRCSGSVETCTLSCPQGDPVDCPSGGWKACSVDQCPAP